jgi:hypothetical protein
MDLRRWAVPVAGLLAVAALTACGGSSSGVAPASSTAGSEESEGPMTAPPAGSSSSAAAPADGQVLPQAVTGGPLLQQEPNSVTPPSVGIEGLLAWQTTGYGEQVTPPGSLEHQHVAEQVDYAVIPPVGGPHNGIWLNAGVYTEPVPSERAVHDLEHGAVWITYRPGLPADEVAALTAFVEKQSMVEEQNQQANRYVVMSPWADDALPAPVVISAWGYQLRVDSAADPRLQPFVDTFRHSEKYSPEYGSPVDGVPILTGGRPASAGSKLPNPDGAVG